MGAPPGGMWGSGTTRSAGWRWSGSCTKQLQLCHRSNFVWKNFLHFDLKMFEPRLEAGNQTQTCCPTQNNRFLLDFRFGNDFEPVFISNQITSI